MNALSRTITTLLLTLAVVAVIIAPAAAEDNPPTEVTSRRVCLFRDSECAPSEYCFARQCRTRSIVPRGGACDDTLDCRSNLVCYRPPASATRTCVPPRALSQRCNGGDCAAGLECSFQSNTCVSRPVGVTGLLGGTCRDHPDCDSGLFCESGSRTCAPVKRAGRPCDGDEECAGFCSVVCVPRRGRGTACSEDKHCFSSLFCAYTSGPSGTCQPKSARITTLGTPCDRTADTCDSERGLVCAPAGRGPTRCQQRPVISKRGRDYCARSRPALSPCFETKGRPAVCVRRQFSATAPFFGCVPRIATIPRGRPCNFGSDVDATCASGMQCRQVMGVTDNAIGTGRLPSLQPFTACVKVVQLDAACGNKFRTQCDDGLRCAAGKCVVGEKVDPFFDTHSGIQTLCGPGDPCAPGFACTNGVCRVPTKTVGAGDFCFQLILQQRTCPQGYACLRKASGLGLQRCRRPFGRGAVCASDEQCRGSLECAPTSPVAPFGRRCVDPTTAIAVGAACNPTNKTRDCAIIPEDPFFSAAEVTACLKRNNGRGFACLKPRTPYQSCVNSDTGCIAGLACRAGLCVPE